MIGVEEEAMEAWKWHEIDRIWVLTRQHWDIQKGYVVTVYEQIDR